MDNSVWGVRLSPDEHEYLDDLASQTEGILSKAGVMRVLIRHAKASGWDPIDSRVTLAERPAAEGSGASSSSIPKSINKKKNKKEGRKETIYPDAFTQFWKAYQQLPEKASKQSKPLALQAWEQATEFTPAADLQRAVEKQLTIQQQEINGRGFTVAMPDCFRWLRDECFHALLEGLDNPQSTSPSWLIK